MASKRQRVATTSGIIKSTSLLCNICKRKTDEKSSVLCSTCNNRYEFDCVGLSEKLYLLMDKKSRKAWKCKFCLKPTLKKGRQPKLQNKSSTPVLPVNMESTPKVNDENQTSPNSSILDSYSIEKTPEYVTKRNKIIENIPTSNSFQSLSEDDEVSCSSILSPKKLNRSCPEIGNNLHDQIDRLQKRVLDLEQKLASAENEIDTMLSENFTLKKSLSEHEEKIEQLKYVSKSNLKQAPEKKGRKSLNRTRMNFSLNDSKLEPKVAQKQTESDSNSQTKQKTNSLPENTQNETQGKDPAPPSIRKSHIYILGDEQVQGLPARLIETRLGKWNDDYDISGNVKTGAPSSFIINIDDKWLESLTTDDIVILALGSNDKNPQLLFNNLYNILHKLKNNIVFVLGVQSNPFLNVFKLNNELKLILNRYDNCTFLDLTYYNYKYDYNVKFRKNIDFICYKLNIEIDYLRYKSEYIDNCALQVIRQKNLSDMSKKHVYKKGTIPYYFDRQYRKNEATKENNQKKTHLSPKKGTIPYYFDTLRKKKETVPTNHSISEFFRS